MSLLFIEGFEQYSAVSYLQSYYYTAASSMPGRWATYSNGSSNITLDTTVYRTAQPAGQAKSLKFLYPPNPTSYVELGINNSHSTFIIGMAINSSVPGCGWVVRFGSPNTGVHLIQSGVTNTLTLSWDGGNALNLKNDRTSTWLVYTGTNVFMQSTWNYVELKMTYGATGAVTLVVNGTTVANVSSVDTRSHTSDVALTRVLIGWPWGSAVNNSTYFDDIYICNGQGTTNNDFLGAVKVVTLFPTANGTTNQFTPTGTASNWDAVNEQTIDNDTTYVASSTPGYIDQYNVSNLSVTPSAIYGVAVCSQAMKVENSARQYRNTVTVGGTTTNGTTVTPILGTYRLNQDLFQTAPGGAAWTPTDVDNMEIGLETL